MTIYTRTPKPRGARFNSINFERFLSGIMIAWMAFFWVTMAVALDEAGPNPVENQGWEAAEPMEGGSVAGAVEAPPTSTLTWGTANDDSVSSDTGSGNSALNLIGNRTEARQASAPMPLPSENQGSVDTFLIIFLFVLIVVLAFWGYWQIKQIMDDAKNAVSNEITDLKNSIKANIAEPLSNQKTEINNLIKSIEARTHATRQAAPQPNPQAAGAQTGRQAGTPPTTRITSGQTGRQHGSPSVGPSGAAQPTRQAISSPPPQGSGSQRGAPSAPPAPPPSANNPKWKAIIGRRAEIRQLLATLKSRPEYNDSCAEAETLLGIIEKNQTMPDTDIPRMYSEYLKPLINAFYATSSPSSSEKSAFENLLRGMGVQQIPIEPYKTRLDPEMHELRSESRDGGNLNAITEVIRPGYQIDGHVLRKADVAAVQ